MIFGLSSRIPIIQLKAGSSREEEENGQMTAG